MHRVPTAVHVEYYARMVERNAVLRRLITVGGQIAGLGYEEVPEITQVLDRAEVTALRRDPAAWAAPTLSPSARARRIF